MKLFSKWRFPGEKKVIALPNIAIVDGLENLVDEIFKLRQPTYADEDIKDYLPDDIFITPEVIEESVQKKIYEDFIPTISFHFDKNIKDIDYDKLQNLFGKDAVILNIECFPTIIQIALLSIKDFGPTVQAKLEEYIRKLNLNSPNSQSVIGNLASEPKIHIPTEDYIRNLCSNPSLNHIQKPAELDKKKINKIQQIVLQRLRKNRDMFNWKFLLTYKDLYNQMNDKIQEDFQTNPYEMIISNQTFYFNKSKYMSEYENIKKIIPEKEVVESFFYHGTRLKNHPRVLSGKQTDAGFFGKGVYATNNPFYASIFCNGNKILDIDEKSQIICCRAIYNGTKINDLTDDSELGKPIQNVYGVNHSFVGDSTGFLPINPATDGKSTVVANEFVFSKKFQIIPLCSFNVMRKSHFILWKDENVYNDANTKFYNELSKKTDVNIYAKDSIESALKIIQNKKCVPFKLITNGGGKDLTGKKLIEKARSITKSKFVCLVFATSPTHLDWVTKMENVLFTSDKNDVRKFVELKMDMNDFLAYTSQLSNKFEAYNYKFKINEDELMNFSYDGDQQQECNLA